MQNTLPTQIIIALMLSLLIASCSSQKNNTDTFLGVPKEEIQKATISHLNKWFPTIVDKENGGYYTNFEYDWTLSDDQPKTLVAQARGLWTASKASSLFPDSGAYRDAADHGYQFITERMWDDERGGFFNELDANLTGINNEHKLIYGNAFALFGLAEYAKINPDPEVISWVNRVFGWIDSVAYDTQNGGYFNLILYDDLKETVERNPDAAIELGWGGYRWKCQNNNIHIMEAFTEAFRVAPNPTLGGRLEETLTLIRDTMTTPKGYLNLYFTPSWEPITNTDSSREYIIENRRYDHISFGHDIETAFLIIDASRVLYGEADRKTLSTAKLMAEHTLNHGFDSDMQGVLYQGYRFEENDTVEIIDPSKSWWVQYEAWHAFALLHTIDPDNELYGKAFRQLWEYINNNLIDHQHGGCYSWGLDTNPDNKSGMKAYQWKTPYHDGRALMNVWEYMEL